MDRTCEKGCEKKCYIKLKDGTLIQKLCKEALRRVFNECSDIIKKEIVDRDISIEKFYELRDSKVKFDTEENKKNAENIQSIRNAIEAPNENDIFEKAMTKLSFDKYVKGTGRILGFVALAKHLNKLKNPGDYIESLALPTYFNIDDPIYLIRFILHSPEDIDEKLIIPFDEPGKEPNSLPCTGNGFTASKNENTLPEYKFTDTVEVEKGSQAFKIDFNSTEELVEVYDDTLKRFVPFDGTTIVKINGEYFQIDRTGNKTPVKIDESKIIEFIP